MSRVDIPVPGLLWGDYPEREIAPKRLAERCDTVLRQFANRFESVGAGWLRWRDATWIAKVRAAQAELGALEPAAALGRVRALLIRQGLSPEGQIQALALAALAAQRCLGQQPFDTQWIAARAVLDNRLAEMATGEGKTLAVALAAAAGALTGMPVHVVTANDYLVARDAQRLAGYYAALGLSVGQVVQADEPDARGRAYACDVTYVTAKELVFDYLRDGLGAATSAPTGATGPIAAPVRRRREALAAPLARLQLQHAKPALLRGLCMTIVDEADAILIDEARVPLILSQAGDASITQDHARAALRFARTLREGADYELDTLAHAAHLTNAGRTRLANAAEALASASASPAWRNRLHREHAVSTALAAQHLYQSGRQYLVREGQVVIVDETTGRVAEGRAWSNGLQQLIEAKENVEPSPTMSTLAQITYQRFFPRYLRLGGLSGTLRDARAELTDTYGVTVRQVPLRRPSRRRVLRSRLFASHATLWPAVAERIAERHAFGQPVLAACDSVAEAQALADHLQSRGLPHVVLHARNDGEEARVVASAGQRGAITVTTNMAGRGTDIELGAGVDALGGLHVISCQLNSARRIDRQLAGRAARQGDPGTVETWLSLDTTLLARWLPARLRALLRGIAPRLPSSWVDALARAPQRAEEGSQREQRRRLIQRDERAESRLGFAGVGE